MTWLLIGLTLGVALAYGVVRLAGWLKWQMLVSWVGVTSFFILPIALMAVYVFFAMGEISLGDPDTPIEIVEQTSVIPNDWTLAVLAASYFTFLLSLGVFDILSDKACERRLKCEGKVSDK